MAKWFNILPAQNDKPACVMLYDGIGMADEPNQDMQDCVDALNALPGPEIDLRIDSDGGSIFKGLSLVDAIRKHPADITAHVISKAASAASFIAVACDKVCMDGNALMMMHKGSVGSFGTADDLRKEADILDKLNGSIAQIYAAKTGKAVDEIKAAMDAVSWFTAEEAKAFGLIDEIEGDDDETPEREQDRAKAVMALVLKYNNVPEPLRRFAARLIGDKPKPPTKELRKMLDTIKKDGKVFLKNTDGTAGDEINIVTETPAPVLTATNQAPDTAALVKAKEDGIKSERDYRSAFTTVMATAKMSADDAAKFENKYYGRSIEDVKEFASLTIGNRANPVGEGGPGNTENEEETKHTLAATARWNADSGLRARHGCGTSSVTSPQYQARMASYVAAEARCRADQKSGGNPQAISDPANDPVTQILQNKSAILV